MQRDAPVIETARLRLRAHRAGDFDAALAMWTDPAVTRYIGGKPSTEQQTWARMLNYAGSWALLGFGYWAVEEKSSGRFIGEAGFANFRRDIAADMKDVPELGWALSSAFHGRGFGTEAVRAAVAWGDAALSSHRTVCLIDPDNAPSIRVAETCGYREFRREQFNGKPALFFERDARPRPPSEESSRLPPH